MARTDSQALRHQRARCTTDFYPTTLDLLGIKMPDQIEPIDGVSLLPLIDGKMAAGRSRFRSATATRRG